MKIYAIINLFLIILFCTASKLSYPTYPILFPEHQGPLPAQRLEPRQYILPMEYAPTVIYYCDETGVPIWLACRLFAWESGWNPRAKHYNANGSIDIGIAQINSYNLKEFSKRYNDGNPIDSSDAETSIRVGIRHIADLYSDIRDWRGAIQAYNIGYYRWIQGDLPRKSIVYGKRIMGEI